MAIGQWAGRVGPLRIIALTPGLLVTHTSLAFSYASRLPYTPVDCHRQRHSIMHATVFPPLHGMDRLRLVLFAATNTVWQTRHANGVGDGVLRASSGCASVPICSAPVASACADHSCSALSVLQATYHNSRSVLFLEEWIKAG
jgi:hypothetical protein